jgi:hypothetical protein
MKPVQDARVATVARARLRVSEEREQEATVVHLFEE